MCQLVNILTLCFATMGLIHGQNDTTFIWYKMGQNECYGQSCGIDQYCSDATSFAGCRPCKNLIDWCSVNATKVRQVWPSCEAMCERYNLGKRIQSLQNTTNQMTKEKQNLVTALSDVNNTLLDTKRRYQETEESIKTKDSDLTNVRNENEDLKRQLQQLRENISTDRQMAVKQDDYIQELKESKLTFEVMTIVLAVVLIALVPIFTLWCYRLQLEIKIYRNQSMQGYSGLATSSYGGGICSQFCLSLRPSKPRQAQDCADSPMLSRETDRLHVANPTDGNPSSDDSSRNSTSSSLSGLNIVVPNGDRVEHHLNDTRDFMV